MAKQKVVKTADSYKYFIIKGAVDVWYVCCKPAVVKYVTKNGKHYNLGFKHNKSYSIGLLPKTRVFDSLKAAIKAAVKRNANLNRRP